MYLSEGEKAKILEGLGELVIYVDLEMKIVWGNQITFETIGDKVGYKCFDVWHRRVVPCKNCPVINAVQSGEVQKSEIESPGGRFWMVTGSPLRNNSGKVSGAVEVAIEITKFKQNERELRQSEQKFKDLVEHSGDWIWEVDDAKGVFTYANTRAEELIGYKMEEIIGRSPFYFVKPEELEKVFQQFMDAITKQEPFNSLTYTMIHKEGHEIVFETNARPFYDDNGNLKGYRGINRDITRRKRYEERLRFLTMHDQLTGIYNRYYFEEEMQRLSQSRDYPITLISADLDGLKAVNDTMGHTCGDNLLKSAAEVITSSLRKSDIVARIGGDEFAIILPRTDNEQGEKIVERIRENISSCNKKYLVRPPISISIGMATAEEEGNVTLYDIFKKADDYMYQEKKSKSSNTVISTQEETGE